MIGMLCNGRFTVVVRGASILEKPDDATHARTMLKSLSGASHQVVTGVCLITASQQGPAYAVDVTKLNVIRFQSPFSKAPTLSSAFSATTTLMITSQQVNIASRVHRLY